MGVGCRPPCSQGFVLPEHLAEHSQLCRDTPQHPLPKSHPGDTQVSSAGTLLSREVPVGDTDVPMHRSKGSGTLWEVPLSQSRGTVTPGKGLGDQPLPRARGLC